jgi:hypothetical protein
MDKLIQILDTFCHYDLINKKIIKRLKNIDFNDYEKISEIIFNQQTIYNFDPTYSLYKLNIDDNTVEHYLDISTNIDNIFHTNIQAEDTYLLLHILSIETFIKFLITHNDGRKYLIIPLIMNSEKMDMSHFTLIVIDYHNNKIFIVDSNAESTFNDIYNKCKYTQITITFKIDKLFEFYINQLNEFGFEYEFISSTKLNPKKNKYK